MQAFDDYTAALFGVGQVASTLGVTPAFLRRIEAHDLVAPARSDGDQRRYSRADVDRITQVLGLVQDGHTLAGVREVLALHAEVAALRAQVRALGGEPETP